MPRLHESDPFQGSYGQPRETTQHLLGPIWATFRPTKFKTHYVAPQFFILWRTVQIAPNFLHWNAHIFLFWLNPTGHSKFHNTSNHPPPATDSGRTARTPLYPPVQAVRPYSLPPFCSCPGQRNRRRRALQQLALNVHVKRWPAPPPPGFTAMPGYGSKPCALKHLIKLCKYLTTATMHRSDNIVTWLLLTSNIINITNITHLLLAFVLLKLLYLPCPAMCTLFYLFIYFIYVCLQNVNFLANKTLQ